MVLSLKYNPGFEPDDDILKRHLLRSHILDLILEILRDNQCNSNQHILIVGPRGIGKTTIVRRVAAEARTRPELSSKWYPVIFSEEAYEVGSPGEFWLEALFRIADQTAAAEMLATHDDLRSESSETRLRERALRALLDFADQTQKRLLLIVENLNMIVSEQLKGHSDWDLRHTLQNEPRIMLLGTATSRFQEIDKANHAWFDLFSVYHLNPLNAADTQQLWRSLTGTDATADEVRPIWILTGGNPRLIRILADFAMRTSFRQLLQDLVHLVDEHTEYFKSQLDHLAASERRVFVALLDLWDPSTAREIAEKSRTPVNAASALLKRLVQRGAVASVEGLQGKRLYQAAERLYNIYYLMRRRGHPSNRVRATVRFMVPFYRPEQLVSAAANLAEEACLLAPEVRREYYLAYEEIAVHRCTPEMRITLINSTRRDFFSNQDVPDQLLRLRDQTVSDTKKRALLMAEKAMDQGDHAEGARLAQAATDLDPSVASGWGALAWHLANSGSDLQRAEGAARKAVELEPSDGWYWVVLGNILHDLNKHEESCEIAKKVVTLSPANLLVSSLRTLAHRLSGHTNKPQEAEEALRRASALEPENADVARDLGIVLAMQKKLKEAEDELLKSTMIEPMESATWAELGDFYHYVGKYSGAIEASERAIRINDHCVRAWHTLVEVHTYHTGQLERAESCAKKGLESNSKDETLWLYLGKALTYQSKFSEAEASFQTASDLAPTSIEVANELGNFLARRKRFSEAEAQFKQSLAISPTNPDTLEQLGTLYLQMKKPEEAEEALRNSVKYGHKTSTLLGLGRLLEKAGKMSEARSAFAEAAGKAPYAWVDLVRFDLTHGDVGKAMESARSYLSRKDYIPYDLVRIADVIYESNLEILFDEAITLLKEAVRIEPLAWETVETLINLYIRSGRWNEALKASPALVSAASKSELALKKVTDFAIQAAAAGHGQRMLELAEESDSASALEPLVVGLKLYLDKEIQSAQELMELGKDVVARINLIKKPV